MCIVDIIWEKFYVDCYFFDYVFVFCKLVFYKFWFLYKKVNYRKIKLVDVFVFVNELVELLLCKNIFCNFNVDIFSVFYFDNFVEIYNNIFFYFLDLYVLFKIKIVVLRFKVVWYNDEIYYVKFFCRKVEWKWRKIK